MSKRIGLKVFLIVFVIAMGGAYISHKIGNTSISYVLGCWITAISILVIGVFYDR